MTIVSAIKPSSNILGGLAVICCLLFTAALAGEKEKPVAGGIANEENGNDQSGLLAEPVVLCGDIDGDGFVNATDIDFFIDFYFNFGPAPAAPEDSDLNCDGFSDIADIVFLASFLGGQVETMCCDDGGYPEEPDIPNDGKGGTIGDF